MCCLIPWWLVFVSVINIKAWHISTILHNNWKTNIYIHPGLGKHQCCVFFINPLKCDIIWSSVVTSVWANRAFVTFLIWLFAHLRVNTRGFIQTGSWTTAVTLTATGFRRSGVIMHLCRLRTSFMRCHDYYVQLKQIKNVLEIANRFEKPPLNSLLSSKTNFYSGFFFLFYSKSSCILCLATSAFSLHFMLSSKRN